MDVPQEVIDTRLAQWQPKPLPLGGGSGTYLSQYAQLVQPIAQGAVLGKRRIHAKNID